MVALAQTQNNADHNENTTTWLTLWLCGVILLRYGCLIFPELLIMHDSDLAINKIKSMICYVQVLFSCSPSYSAAHLFQMCQGQGNGLFLSMVQTTSLWLECAWAPYRWPSVSAPLECFHNFSLHNCNSWGSYIYLAYYQSTPNDQFA